MYYITGDIHGNFNDLHNRCDKNKIIPGDTLIILGDASFNYFNNYKDEILKKKVSELNITIFCIHGNHEIRPETIPSYKTKKWNNGLVYYEEKYPDLLFAKDGEIYNINNKSIFVCGGAYSVDKYYRAARFFMTNQFYDNTNKPNSNMLINILKIGEGSNDISDSDVLKTKQFLNKNSGIFSWWKDEQPSKKIKEYCEELLALYENTVDIILTHTCPEKYEPVEVFINGLNQRYIDKTTEKWLDKIENNLSYAKWYCGHYHTDKQIDKIRFMYCDVQEL